MERAAKLKGSGARGSKLGRPQQKSYQLTLAGFEGPIQVIPVNVLSSFAPTAYSVMFSILWGKDKDFLADVKVCILDCLPEDLLYQLPFTFFHQG